MSRDEVADSREFARRYGIEFPLISDIDGEISRALVGIDRNDHAIPGVVVIRRDGTIVFRQIAHTKDDRLTARALLAEVDRVLGTSGEQVDTRTPSLDRIQLRADAGAGQLRTADGWLFGMVGGYSLHVPLDRHVISGVGLRQATSASPLLSIVGSIGLRFPWLGDLAALEVAGEAGLPIRTTDVYAGVRVGLSFAWTPRWGFGLSGTLGAYAAGADDPLPGWSLGGWVTRFLGR